MTIRFAKLIRSRPHLFAVLLGVVYGIAMRVAFGLDWSRLDGLVSFSFFVLVPFVVGFLATCLAGPPRSTSLRWAIFGPWIAIFGFLATSVVLLLEGSVCVAIALPAFRNAVGSGTRAGTKAWSFARRSRRAASSSI